MRAQLVKMLEWHARATRGADLDTWYDGRFIDRWADPRAVATLPAVFALYEPESLNHAVLSMATLFRWLSAETAAQLGYGEPDDEHLSNWTRSMLTSGES
jgi:aminoglycoside 6-adenylyltransferase